MSDDPFGLLPEPVEEAIGVFAQPVRNGVLFEGPARKLCWSPSGGLSIALSFVSGRFAPHPWDAWPNPGEPKLKRPPGAPRAGAQKPKSADAARQARERRLHG